MGSHFKKVLIATDLSPPSDGAVIKGLQMAADLGADARVLHVIKPMRQIYLFPDYQTTKVLMGSDFEQKMTDLQEKESKKAFLRYKKKANNIDLEWEGYTVEGNPVEQILAEAEGADLLIIAAVGRGANKYQRLGKVSRALLKHATCPVTLVKVTES